jgi:tetraacyldisaccharide 4'-kinase
VGGTGKTPVASWVARRCEEEGGRPALLLSGHGRDEVLLHRRWTPAIPVLVGRDRVDAARRALAQGADVAIVDDGFQHRRLARDLDIVLLAVEDRFPGRVLPRGPYREGPGALLRADAIVVTRRSGGAEEARALADRVRGLGCRALVAGIRIVGGHWFDLRGDPSPEPRGEALAVAAVGRPAAFGETVRGLLGARVELAAFPDHHEFGARDAERLRAWAGSRAIVTTEKDAVKLASFSDTLGDVYVLRQEIAWDWGERAFRDLLTAALREGGR